jgi:hypothetical protein
MMQAVLEERFRLRVHRETRALPVYNLVVAKRGSKLTPFTGGCRALDMDGDGFVPPLAPGEKPCESFASFDGPVLRMDAVGQHRGGFRERLPQWDVPRSPGR